ncbi:conjugal transfer protein TraF [Candidatus Binatia bacterium]|nr:conjugal transfer protein TraF [Candidatus Binatia bacterium]
MRIIRRLQWMVVVVALAAAARVEAAPFGFIGPRQVGMGGAGVSATEDAHAIYWNPAGLALHDGLDIRLSGTVRASVNQNLDDAIDKIRKAVNSGSTSQEVIDYIDGQLDQISANASGGTNGGGGIFAKMNWEENAFGLAFYDEFNGTASLPLRNPGALVLAGRLFNGSVVALDGLEGRQFAVSYARSLFDKTLTLGVTASAIQGVVYIDRSFVQDSNTGVEFVKDYDQSRSSWDASVDVGMDWTPISWLRFGMVGKYLNRPTFDAFDASDIKINGVPPNLPPEFLARVRQQLADLQGRFQLAPQGRASVTAFPMEGMTVSADVDVTPNPTFVKDADSQIMSVGGEQLFFDRLLATRLGVYYDFTLPDAEPVPTIGLGTEYAGFSFDIAGAYDFQKSAGGLAVGFGYSM